MLKNIIVGILAATLVVALGTAFYNVAVVDAAGGNVFGNIFGSKLENERIVMLEGIPASEITDQEALSLIKVAELSQMVEDVEHNAVVRWQIEFPQNGEANIASVSEDFQFLFDRYNIIDPNNGEVGIYTNLDILSAYQVSVAMADVDKGSAIKGIAFGYEMLIQAVLDAIEITDNEDVLYVYQYLMNHDSNHFRNWVTAYQAETGIEYVPQIVSEEVYSGLITGVAGHHGQQNDVATDVTEGSDGTVTEQAELFSQPLVGTGVQRGAGQQGAGQNAGAMITVHGEMIAYEFGTLTILADDGSTVGASIGNQEYALTIGFAPIVGDFMTITGTYGEEGLLSVASITMDVDGTVYSFRSSGGRPDWAGGGGGGNGKGQGSGQIQ